jgi:hypothetical protein
MKRIKVLVLVLAFAFAAMGGAYAMWSDSLLIDETVSTGHLDVSFSALKNPDPGPFYTGYVGQAGNPYGVYGVNGNEGLDELDPGNPNANKNIAAMTAVIEDQTSGDAGAFDNNDDVLTIGLENGYPGYQDRIFTTITNNGTVPAKFDISSFNAIGVSDDLLVEIWFDADPTQAKDNGEDFMVWNNSGRAIDLPLEGYQIDPGESIPVAIYTRVLQSANQDDDYAFSITLNAQQWNEYGYELPSTIEGNTIGRVDRLIDGIAQPDEPKFEDQ